MYTKCELYWPTAVLIIALLLVAGSSGYGFTNSSALGNGVNTLVCSLAIAFDDILNGNIANDNKTFFAGINTANTQLTYLSNNISNINTNISALNKANAGTMQTTYNQGTTTLTDISKVPTNTAGNSMADFTYDTPFNAAASGSTGNSLFPSVLGGVTAANGTTYAIHQVVNAVQVILDGVSTAAAGFSGSIAGFGTAIGGIQSSITSLSNQISGVDSMLGNTLSFVKTPVSYMNIGVQVFFGVAIGMSILGILGAILMACCDKYGCRYLIYFSCLFLFLIGIIGFLIAFVSALLVPVLYLGCDFLSVTFGSAAGFNANIGSYIPSNMGTYVTVCLPSGTGLIIDQLGGGNLQLLNNLTNIMTSMNSFNASQISSTLTSSMTTYVNSVGDYANARIWDLPATDSASLTILTKLATPTDASNSACFAAAAQFQLDNWIPAINQNPSYVGCSLSTQSTKASCGVNTITASATCQGCMDTFNIFSGNATIDTRINTRYGNVGGCNAFATAMNHAWINFYSKKNTQIGPVYARAQTAQTSLTTYANSISSNIGPLFTNTITNLGTVASSVTDPTYGLVAGLNCKVVG